MKKFNKKNLSSSSKAWIRRSKNNLYTFNANLHNIPSRSYFKLEEIQNKYHLFQKHQTVLDLGCSPGGWSCLLKKHHVIVHGCDLLNTMTTPIEKFILGDFTDEEVRKEFTVYNSILSDMAINATGNRWVDQYRNHQLATQVWEFVQTHLLAKGNFIIKLFESEYTHDFIKDISFHFKEVHKFKPSSSYKDSSEIYLVAIKYIK